MTGTVLLILRFVLAAALFAFLGMALYILWRELKQQSNLLAFRKAPPITLIYQRDAEFIPFQLSREELTIGRDPSCDCVVSDSTVSAQHARLIYRQGQWWVEDLHSTNGTFLNSENVFAPLVVANGDQLRCGQAIFLIKFS